MAAVLAPLLLAGLSTLAFVAYRHPAAYQRSLPYLLGLVVAAVLVAIGYRIGAKQVLASLKPYLVDLPPNRLKEATDSLEGLSGWDYFLLPGLILFGAYAALLGMLDRIGVVHDDSDRGRKS